MEINEYYKSPELFRMIKEHFKEEQKPSYSFDITPSMRHITARNQDGSITKDISYGDLNPGNVYALRMTTTNVDTGTQETSFALFLDRKMAEVHFTQNKTLNDLTINREVLTGVMVEGNFDGNLLKQLNVGIEDFNRAAIFSTTQDRYASGQFPQIEKNASTIAERLFNDIQLKNEYVSNMVGRGTIENLNRYYELSRDQNSSVRHIDAFLVEEHKEALAKAQVQQAANNEQYQYIGIISSKDHSEPSVAYTNEKDYLHAIEEGLKTNPNNLAYETISQDPQLQKHVEDLTYKFYGLTNPYPIEYYTPQGRDLKIEDMNHPQVTIMDLAKEMGFAYRNTNQEGDVVMQKVIQPDENSPRVTQIDLLIKNADNPLTNIVTAEYSTFPNKNSMSQDANFNPIAQDAEFHLPFNDFVNLTKSLNSEEILKSMEQKQTLDNSRSQTTIHNTIPSENRIVIDHYHNTELFPLIDKQFNKISPAPLIDAYEIGLINESKLSVLPLYDKGQIELTPGDPKQIDIKDLAPTKIHAYFEYTTNVSTLEQLPKYKLSLDENNERLHNSREQLPHETVKHGVAIHGDFDNHFVNLTANGDQNQAVLIALASTMANDPYFKITEQTPFFVLDAISKGREQAEGLFHDLTLTNEYSTNIEPQGTNEDVLQYYKLTIGEEPQLFHINSTEVDDYKNKVQREIHMGQEHPEDKYTKLNYTPLLDQSFIEKTFSALIIKNADEEKNTVNRQIFDLTNDLVQPIIKTDPLNSKIAAQALINYAKEHPENEYARQIIENHELQKSKTQPLEKTNIEVDLKKDFQYETASIRPQTHLINDLMDKYKLNSSTILKFAPFIEAAHPVNKPHTDNSQDTVVFPYVKTNSSYNLDGHIASTMSADPSIINKSKTNTTNAPIGYEHYTKGQKIPITHHTNTAAIEGGTWMATTAKNPEDVKTVHIYNSAIDAMSSYELHKIKPELENTAFISVGTMAHNSQIRGIKELFPNATMYLNFQNNIMGELSTIKSVAVLADNPVNIKTDGKNIDFKLSDGLEFKLNASMTNYKNFEKMSGINHLDIPNLIVLPPAKGITWNDTLKQQNTQRQDEKQEHHRGMKL